MCNIPFGHLVMLKGSTGQFIYWGLLCNNPPQNSVASNNNHLLLYLKWVWVHYGLADPGWFQQISAGLLILLQVNWDPTLCWIGKITLTGEALLQVSLLFFQGPASSLSFSFSVEMVKCERKHVRLRLRTNTSSILFYAVAGSNQATWPNQEQEVMFTDYAHRFPGVRKSAAMGSPGCCLRLYYPHGVYKGPTLANTISSFETRGLKLKYLQRSGS